MSGDPLRARRAVLWLLIGSKIIGGWGLQWDIQWHVTIGRDSFWIAPHVMIYASVAIGFVLAFGVLVHDTLVARRGTATPLTALGGPSMLTILGLSGSRGFHLAAWGIGIVVLAAPIDDLWHRLFGIDVTLWSPPHLLGLGGSALNTLGCLLIASEVYPRDTRARLAACLLAGTLFFGGLRIMLDPAYLLAYSNGGVLFHTYGILAALALPVALVATAKVSARRWAPIAIIVIAIGIGMAGEQIATVGFAIVQPVSVIGEEIAKDPTSAIATANAIREKNRGGPPAWTRLIAFVPALAMALADPRLRPIGASLAYGVVGFVISGWYLSLRPAFQPMIPSIGETAVALVVAIAAAFLGGAIARWVADPLELGRATDLEALPRPVA